MSPPKVFRYIPMGVIRYLPNYLVATLCEFISFIKTGLFNEYRLAPKMWPLKTDFIEHFVDGWAQPYSGIKLFIL